MQVMFGYSMVIVTGVFSHTMHIIWLKPWAIAHTVRTANVGHTPPLPFPIRPHVNVRLRAKR